jgi:hypothetical protein
MPEIAEAHTLLATLAETDEAKSATADRHRRLQLQTRYGRAMMWTKGLGSAETKAAFEGAQSLVDGAGDMSDLQPFTGCGSPVWCAASCERRKRPPRPSGAMRVMENA